MIPRVPREALAAVEELHRWRDRRDWYLERWMTERGIASSREVEPCEWEMICEVAEVYAGPRPPGIVLPTTPTTDRPPTPSPTFEPS